MTMNEEALRLLIQQITGITNNPSVGDRGLDTLAERDALMRAYGTAQGSIPALNQQLGPAAINQINQSGIAERGISTAAERQFMEGAYQEALGKNRAENDLRTMRETGVPSQRELLQFITRPSQVSSGDPDGMTAPPMQLSAEEIATRQAAYSQQQAQQQAQQQLNGEQMQQRDDSLFDQMVRQRMGR